MITQVSKRYLECIDIMAPGEAKTLLSLSAKSQPFTERRPTWRTQHLTNALFKAFKRATRHPQGRARFFADEA